MGTEDDRDALDRWSRILERLEHAPAHEATGESFIKKTHAMIALAVTVITGIVGVTLFWNTAAETAIAVRRNDGRIQALEKVAFSAYSRWTWPMMRALMENIHERNPTFVMPAYKEIHDTYLQELLQESR